jgi:hypothetical protein
MLFSLKHRLPLPILGISFAAFAFLASTTFRVRDFLIFWLLGYLSKVIPERRRTH